MFQSVKSKTILITLSIFTVFYAAFSIIEYSGYQDYKILKTDVLNNKIEGFAEDLQDNIYQMENNVRAVALSAAGGYFYSDNKQQNFDFIIKDNFKNNNLIAIGGGIWFEPYTIDSNKKRVCSYASWNNNDINLDKGCDSDNYDYLNKIWYKSVKNHFSITTKNDTVWTAPYYDEIGTKNLMVTVGTALYDKNNKFIGVATEDWLLNTITNKIGQIDLTPHTLIVFADKKNDYIISTNIDDKLIGRSLKNLSWYSEDIKDNGIIKIDNKDYITFFKSMDNGMIISVNVPVDEVFAAQKQMIIFAILLEVLSILIFAFLVYLTLTRNVNRPIDVLVKAAKKIGQGNFDTHIDIKKPKEFAQLADTVNTMSEDIKNYLENIKELNSEKNQIESDLNIAKEIQKASLPSVFPPFPDIVSLDIFASMHTAKQVGGDFYDFYFINKNHIAFTVADVSGKGVPAALFMMEAKSVLKSLSLSHATIESIMMKVNNTICENNEKGLFVTVGLGVINITTGEVIYVNAGHNPPILKSADSVKYLDVPSNLVIGIMENVHFEVVKFNLEPCDTLFMYTDGVTEANNSNQELFGEDRLLEVIKNQNGDTKEIISGVEKSLHEFANGYEQFDDITMLGITYLGNENFIKKLRVGADIKEIASFLQWVENNCKKCGIKDVNKILIAAEEIFSNIAYYSYPNTSKEYIQDITTIFKYIKPLNEVSLVFINSGVHYNPLEKDDPDITLGVEERPVGGLGIYMTKQMMDDVKYEYKNKQNILTLKYKVKEQEC